MRSPKLIDLNTKTPTARSIDDQFNNEAYYLILYYDMIISYNSIIIILISP
ncbi:hypothetical protein C8R11_12251 [Nitrosomonas aestuarii]|nr:hypothetical protein C8R11_12251 [Nitrosomonas aestuarii]